MEWVGGIVFLFYIGVFWSARGVTIGFFSSSSIVTIGDDLEFMSYLSLITDLGGLLALELTRYNGIRGQMFYEPSAVVGGSGLNKMNHLPSQMFDQTEGVCNLS